MVAWSKELEIGIGNIDNQHKAIFVEINKLVEAYDKGEEKEQTYKALCFIEEYVNKHFITEEFYLKKYDYPKIEDHIKLHEGFSRQLEDFKLHHQKSGMDKLAFQEMMKFLLDWWYKHILEVDRQYVEFISAKMKSLN